MGNSGCGVQLVPIYHTPLTYDIYNALTNNDEQISKFVLSYFCPLSGITQVLYIGGGRVDQTNYFGSIETFESTYFEENINTIDIVISDIQMPGTDGLVLLDYVKKHSPGGIGKVSSMRFTAA